MGYGVVFRHLKMIWNKDNHKNFTLKTFIFKNKTIIKIGYFFLFNFYMKNLLLFILLFISIITQVNAKTWDINDDITIKELWNNIKKLQVEQTDLNNRNLEIDKTYWTLVSFIKEDISKEDFYDIKNEIEDFIKIRNSLEQDIIEKIKILGDTKAEKENLIFEKTNFYKFLFKYVKDDKKEDFLKYIDLNIETEKEKKEVVEQISKKQILLEKKVNDLKEKIETHKVDLSQKLEISITSRIISKIDEIDKNEKYKSIDKEAKNKIYLNFINDIKTKISQIEKSNLTQNYKQVKINILERIISEIEKKIK